MNDMNSHAMTSKSIRWLHLSDFHVGKENYSQISMFGKILANVGDRVKKGMVPDLVFLTGDIANKGREEEYKEFEDNFLIPLCEILGDGWDEKIYSVPGNHDIDIGILESKAVKKHHVLDSIQNFLDPDESGLKLRKPLLPEPDALTFEKLKYLLKIRLEIRRA